MNPLVDYEVAMSIAKEMADAAELLHRRRRVESDPPRDLPSYDDEMSGLVAKEPVATESVGA